MLHSLPMPGVLWPAPQPAPCQAPALTRPLAVRTGAAALVDLCREAGRTDEALLVHLLPYLPFRTAKQQLPIESMCAAAWHVKSDQDLQADLAKALPAWAEALGRGDRQAARRSQLLVAALLRIAGTPEGQALWRPQADGLNEDEYNRTIAFLMS